MLVRVLTMRVVPERLDDWLRFTRDIGFPGMRRQPGCRGIWRLHEHGAGNDYQVVTLWDSLADLERFRASDAMRELSAAGRRPDRSAKRRGAVRRDRGSDAMAILPLADLVVLEFSHTVMGPSCGVVLADLGADVIRVEPAPDGDRTRRLHGFATGFFAYFNRNKRCICIDVKSPDGLAVAQDLVRNADALIENFGPGTMDRLGLGWDAVHALNPRLIYCALKGFLPGPYEHRPSLDEIAQYMTGLAYMTGPPGQPLRAGSSVIDIMGGVMGALAILAALRQRDKDGQGRQDHQRALRSPRRSWWASTWRARLPPARRRRRCRRAAAPGESTRPSPH